jgi:hypothetical protein
MITAVGPASIVGVTPHSIGLDQCRKSRDADAGLQQIMPAFIARLPGCVDNMSAAEDKADDPCRQNADKEQTALGIATLIHMPGSRNQPCQQRSQLPVTEIDTQTVHRDHVLVV